MTGNSGRRSRSRFALTASSSVEILSISNSRANPPRLLAEEGTNAPAFDENVGVNRLGPPVIGNLPVFLHLQAVAEVLTPLGGYGSRWHVKSHITGDNLLLSVDRISRKLDVKEVHLTHR